MGIVRALPDIQDWLDANADCWSSLSDPEYTALVKRWSALFTPLIEANGPTSHGNRAIQSIGSRLPEDVFIFSGVRIPRLANLGGCGPSAYRTTGLRALDRELSNRLELVVVAIDFAWCCVFSHEAGLFVWEHLYDRGLGASQGAVFHEKP